MLQIKINDFQIESAKKVLESGVSDYCSFKPMQLMDAAPVAGSAVHDGTLLPLMEDALSAFNNLVHKDITALISLGSQFHQADHSASQSISGGGGGW